MAQIVGVHGIFCNWNSREQMATAWSEALRTGIANRRLDSALDFTFEAAFYGDLYNAGKSGGDGYGADDVAPGLESEMLLAMAKTLEPAQTEEATKLGVPRAVQAALRVIMESTAFGEATEEIIVRSLKQVREYFDDATLHAKIQAEMAAAVKPDTRVIVAHSLGSVVAYEALRENRDWPVRTLITLGSPLGLPAIRRRLWPPLELDDGWAGSVERWYNIASGRDPIALVKNLATVIHQDIDDRPCSTPYGKAHHAEWYLRNPECVEVVAHALK